MQINIILCEEMKDYLLEWLAPLNFSLKTNEYIAMLVIAFCILLVAIVAYVLFRKMFLQIAHQIADRSRTNWDDMLYNNKFFHKLSHILPAVILYISIPIFFEYDEGFAHTLQVIFDIYFLVVFVRIINAILDTINDIHSSNPKRSHKSIKSYIQLAKIIIYITAGLMAFSSISGQSFTKILFGLGTFTALLILIFQDTIRGLVSGVHLSANDMIRIGDWISVPKYDADGVVLEINLITVKVQNWDKTISTVPTYALVNNSFSNWRGMEESGGRRIKRSLYIDISSVRFLTDEDRSRLSEIAILKDYIVEMDKQVAKASEVDYERPSAVNYRHLTNVGTFRKYLELYLKNHPDIRQDMTNMVRQKQSTEKGLPIEIYCFSRVQAWAKYEVIQADIFDHVFAVAGLFGIRIFQSPTGSDFKRISK